MPSALPVSVRHYPDQCPRCGARDVVLTYCGCGQSGYDVFTCQAAGCGVEIEVGPEDAEELLRRLVMDYGDQLRRLCDDTDCDCSVAAVLRHAEEGE